MADAGFDREPHPGRDFGAEDTDPLFVLGESPLVFTLAFIIGHAKGKFGTSLDVDLPKSTGGGYITGISLNLSKTFSFKGRKRSYISASCPAPKGFPGASFAFAKASFAFIGGKTLTSTLNRSCKVR